MNNYKVVVYVNGRRSELTVSARIMSDAKEIVKAQFADAKLSFGTVTTQKRQVCAMRQDLPFSFLILEISFTVKHFKIVQPQQCGRKAL